MSMLTGKPGGSGGARPADAPALMAAVKDLLREAVDDDKRVQEIFEGIVEEIRKEREENALERQACVAARSALEVERAAMFSEMRSMMETVSSRVGELKAAPAAADNSALLNQVLAAVKAIRIPSASPAVAPASQSGFDVKVTVRDGNGDIQAFRLTPRN